MSAAELTSYLRRSDEVRAAEARFHKPFQPGTRWVAELIHPRHNRTAPMFAEGFVGHSEAEARRQAWRYALLTNLAGYHIRARQTEGQPTRPGG